MITPAFGLTATERVLPRLALDFTTASLDSRVTFTRSGNTATVTNSSGVIVAVNANIPRFDYDPSTLRCKGLLIEEQRTNLLLNSLLDGTILSTQVVTTTATATTLSFYGTGQIVLSGTHSATVVGTGAYPSRKTYTFTPTAGVLTLTVTGTVQYAQLEAGAFATSYIPTTASQVTRSADVATMTGTNFSSWYNATEGTFAGSCDVFSNGFAGIFVTGNTTDQVGAYRNGTTSAVHNIAKVSNVTQVSMTNGTWVNNTTLDFAAAYKTNSYAFSTNANAPTLDTSATVPTVSQLQIGYCYGIAMLNGHFMKLNYYPQRLTDNEVRAFSK